MFDSIFNSHPLFRRIGALSFAFMVTLASPVQSTEISILGTSGVGDESASYYVASELPDREVHVIGLYEAGNNALNVPPEIANDPEAFHEWWLENVFRSHTTFPAQVHVNYNGADPMEPITLVLSSYEPVDWEFTIGDGVQIEEILLNGYHQQNALNVGDIPVSNMSLTEGTGWMGCGYRWPLSTGGCNTPELVGQIEERFNTPISSFSGAYRASHFVIEGSPVGESVGVPNPGVGNLVDGPDADLVYNSSTGDVTIDLSDIADTYPFGDGTIWWQDFSAQRLFFAFANDSGSFVPENLDPFRGEIPSRAPIGSENRISADGVFLRGLENPRQLSLGSIFPPGLQTPEELRDYLTVAHYSTDRENGDFDLIVVPDLQFGEVLAAKEDRLFLQADSLDSMCTEISGGTYDARFDVDLNGVLDHADLELMLGSLGVASGDLNLDRAVAFDDFITLSANFGTEGSWTQGDLSCDGVVQFDDFLRLASNFASEPQALAAVPEPSGAWLMGMLCLFAVLHRRHQCESVSATTS